MELKEIKIKDLIFNGDEGTNTHLTLDDYDWMDYVLITKFQTKELGTLNITFHFFGLNVATMKVQQTINEITETAIYEYPTNIFEKHIKKFLKKHISSWKEEYAFNGEKEVINFFNDVLKNAFKKPL